MAVTLEWHCTEVREDGTECSDWNPWQGRSQRTLGASTQIALGATPEEVERDLRLALDHGGSYWTDQYDVKHVAKTDGLLFKIHRVASLVTTCPTWTAIYTGDVQPDELIEAQPIYEEVK